MRITRRVVARQSRWRALAICFATAVALGSASAPAGGTVARVAVPLGGVAVAVRGLPAHIAASVNSVSCWMVGSCAAGGTVDVSQHAHAFVVNEVKGVWGAAQLVKGVNSDLSAGVSDVTSIACSSTGICVAMGTYYRVHASDPFQSVFVVDGQGTRWGRANFVPGLAALDAGGVAVGMALSCGRTSTCGLGGYYTDGTSQLRGFVAAERNNAWGSALEVPGLAAINVTGGSQVQAMSCTATSNCVAGGFYDDASGHYQGFVAEERNGTWRSAMDVPGLVALNTTTPSAYAAVNAVSCAVAGQCVAVGEFTDQTGVHRGFAATEHAWVWGNATTIPGLGNLGPKGAKVLLAACPAVGACTLAGTYVDAQSAIQGFVANERSGKWGPAAAIRGLAALNAGQTVTLGPGTLSCASAGICAVGGDYRDRKYVHREFYSYESAAKWTGAARVPGVAPLSLGGDSSVQGVACPAPTRCLFVGYFNDKRVNAQGFVTP